MSDTANITVTQHFKQSPDVVFAAWLDQRTAGSWLFKTENGKMTSVQITPKVGGSFSFIEDRDGVEAFHTGEYTDITAPKKLAFTFRVEESRENETDVIVNFVPAANGCDVTLVHNGIFPENAAQTRQGWTGILANLAKILPE